MYEIKKFVNVIKIVFVNDTHKNSLFFLKLIFVLESLFPHDIS